MNTARGGTSASMITASLTPSANSMTHHVLLHLPTRRSQNGGFITSCNIHTTNIGGLSHKITIDNTTMYEAYSAWYFDKEGKGGSQYWWHDVAWPADPTCPGDGITDVEEMLVEQYGQEARAWARM